MKKLQKGFIGIIAFIIIGVLVIGGSTYIYLNKNKKQNNSLTISETSAVIDFKDVKDFDTCMSYAKNITTTFDIVFLHGSDIQEVRNFETDFKTAYPRAKLKVSSEQDYLDEAIAYNRGSIKTPIAMEEYKKGIIAQANSKISVVIPLRDLGSWQSFSNFISETLNKYNNIKFKQYGGSSPENTLSDGDMVYMQKLAEKQCDYKYKELTASERDSIDTKALDQLISISVQTMKMNATNYYREHTSYGSGPLAINNGVCSDSGVYGFKKSLDSIIEKVGVAYCYASANEFAVSVPLKSDQSTGYCTDSAGFFGKTSPTAASKGYCLTPRKISQDISTCKNSGTTARKRWICVGDIVDPSPNNIDNIVMPFATPVSQKIDFCKKFKGVEADYCLSSIVKAGYGLNVNGSPTAAVVCGMVSNQNPWFKNDCEER